MKNNITHSKTGSILVGAILITILITMALLPIVRRSQMENKSSTNSKGQEEAAGLADAGIEKGIFRLTQNSESYYAVMRGEVISGLNGSKWHTNSTGASGLLRMVYGRFTVDLVYGPGPHQFTVTSVGNPTGSNFYVKKTAVYEDISMDYALLVEGAKDHADANFAWEYIYDTDGDGGEIHWGPMYVFRGLTFGDPSNPSPLYYPKKYATWRIENRDNGNDYRPNSDQKEYWANYQDMPSIAELNFYEMQVQSDNHTLFVGDDTFIEDGDWEADDTDGVIEVTSPQKLTTATTWFFDGDLEINDKVYFAGVIIVNGNLIIKNSAQGNNTTIDESVMPIPEGAKDQYKKHVNVYSNYPSHSGLNVNPDATSMSVAADSIGMRGFVYVADKLIVEAGLSNPFYIYGSVYVQARGENKDTSSNFRIYRADYKNDAVQWPLINRPALKRISVNTVIEAPDFTPS